MKKFLKLMLTAAIAGTMALPASAEIKPYGLAVTHFGQLSQSAKTKAYDSDGSATTDKAEADHLTTLYKSKFGVNLIEDDFSAKVWVASRTNEKNASKTNVEVNYKPADALTITMGTALTPEGSVGFTLGGGYMKTETGYLLDLGILHSGMAYIEHPGMILKYNFNPYMAASLGVYTKNTLFTPWLGYPELVASLAVDPSTGKVCSSCLDSNGNPTIDPTKGSGISLSFQGMLSKQLLVGAAYIASTYDEHNGRPTADANALNLTGMLFLGNMVLAADYSTTKRGLLTGFKDAAGDVIDGELSASDLSVMVKMKGFGPGQIGLKVGSMSVDTTTAAYGDLKAASYDETNTHLHYEIPVTEKSCKVGFLYESITKTAKATGAEAETTTFLGGTLAATF